MTSRERKIKEARYLKRQVDKISEQCANEMLDKLVVLSCQVLRKEFGFGEKRMVRFIERLSELLKHVDAGDVKLRTLAAELEDDCRIELVLGSEK